MFDGRFRRWMIAASCTSAVAIVVFAVIVWRARAMEAGLRKKVEQELSIRFQSKVELKAFHVYIFPGVVAVGEELTLRHHNRMDIPPLLQVGRFSFSTGIIGLIRPTKRIAAVHVD